jgi:hypothetical protein
VKPTNVKSSFLGTHFAVVVEAASVEESVGAAAAPRPTAELAIRAPIITERVKVFIVRTR